MYVPSPFGMQIVTEATHVGLSKSNLLGYLMPLEVPIMCHKLGKRGGGHAMHNENQVTQ
jgi:hypothetical protein